MRRSVLSAAVAARRGCRSAWRIVAGQQPPAAGLSPPSQAAAGALGLRRQLRKLPHGGSRRTQRSAAARRQQLHEHVAHPLDEGSLRVHPVDDAADRREPVGGAVSRGHRVHPAGQRRARGRGRVHGDDRGPDRQRRPPARRGPPRRQRRQRDAPRRPAGRQGAPGRSGQAPGGGRGGAPANAGPLGAHRRGHGEELHAGHRRDAAQSGSGRLADGAPQLSGLEPQPADADHAGQREGSAARVELGHERGPGQRAVAARPQRHALSREHPEHRPGARRAHRRSDLGEPRRPERADRPGGDAQHGDLPGQGVRRHDRRAAGRARRAHRRQDLGHDDRRSREGLRQHRRADGDEGRRRQRPRRLRSLRQRRLLDQRLRRGDRQAAVEVQHRPPRHRAGRRDVGQARRQPAHRRRDVDCRQLRSGSRHHLLGRRAGQAVDAREPRRRRTSTTSCTRAPPSR